MKKLVVIAAMAMGALVITGCEEKSPMDQLKSDAAAISKDAKKAGEQAAKDASKAADKVADDLKKAAK